MPKVSIIMCSYNGFPYIKEAVNAVMNQTYEDWELIISDDGSKDETCEWLRQKYRDHPKVRVFFQKKNLGYVANKNFAHQQARGEFITQLDNDDLMAPDKLARQLMVVENTNNKIVGCGYHKIDVTGSIYDTITASDSEIFRRQTVQGYPFWFPSLMVHRDVFNEIGYFNEYFSHALGDDVYWTMLANRKYPIYHIEEVMYSYRSNPGSITNDYQNPRKLVLPRVIDILSAQQEETGTDWLEQKKFVQLGDLERNLLQNRRYMSEKYRMCAAAAMDTGDKAKAKNLLWRAFRETPLSLPLYRTLLYILRK